MMTSRLLPAVLCAVLIAGSANQAMADRWYRSPWFWGGTGLVVGGVAGYAIGRESARPQPVYTPYPAGPCYYPADGSPYLTGGTYVKETRVWPFYRRTEVYPVAATVPYRLQPQAVSLADARYVEDPRVVSSEEPVASQPAVNITIGDNNSDVQINLNGAGTVTEDSKAITETIQVPNPRSGAKRVVDMTVQRPVVEAPAPQAAPEAPAAAPEQK